MFSNINKSRDENPVLLLGKTSTGIVGWFNGEHEKGTPPPAQFRTKIFIQIENCIALNGALVFSHLNNIPEEENVHLGILVTSPTLCHPGAFHPNLSRELGYDQLL